MLLTAHWKLATTIKLMLYNPEHHYSTLRIFDKSYYTQPDPSNKYGYGKIVRPRTEHSMHQDCINVMNELNWKLVAQEWCVSPGVNHHGQGDLVFQKPAIRSILEPEIYMVIEVKRRNSKYVYKQAEFYARKWKANFTESADSARVYYGVWTSYNQEIVGLL